MIRVYLDTNILIQGGARQEHGILKEFSREDKIVLYKSIHSDLELHGKVAPALHKGDAAMRDLNKSMFGDDQKERFEVFTKARKVCEDARKDEQTEKDYWQDSKMTRSPSHFNALIVSMLLVPDYKGELSLFDELLNKYHLHNKDAFHVMEAYSSGMDYFLTWDMPLLKKCKKVHWLKVKSMTPKEFLDAIK